MVVRCVAQLVQSKANNIRSGWKNIFFVFSLAAGDSDRSIVNMAFSTTAHIFERYFSQVNDHRASLIAASFMDAVNCLTEFACNSHFPELSMEAIKQLRLCARTVSDVPDLFVNPNEEESGEPKIWVKGWFPVLFGLSRIITRCKMDVRTRALTVMFEVMKTYGETFLSQWWTDLFRVVFRIFDSKKLHDMNTQQERVEWMSTTCTHALRSIIDVVSQFFGTLENCVVVDLFVLISWCIQQENEQLARAGTECLHILVMNNGAEFADETWELAVNTIAQLFKETAPRELYRFSASGEEQQQQQQQRGERGLGGVGEHRQGPVTVKESGDVAVAALSADAASEASVPASQEQEQAQEQAQEQEQKQANATDAKSDKSTKGEASSSVSSSSTVIEEGVQGSSDGNTAAAATEGTKDEQDKASPPSPSSSKAASAQHDKQNKEKEREREKDKQQKRQQRQQQQQQQQQKEESGGRDRKASREQRAREKALQQQLFNAIVIKSVVQLELIQTVEWIVLSSTKPTSQVKHTRTLQDVPLTPTKHQTDLTSERMAAQRAALSLALDEAGEMFERLTSPRLLVLLDCLLGSHEFARAFNANLDLRTRLWKAGFMKNRSKPNLLKQETTALGCALRILFRIYEAGSRADVRKEVEKRLLQTCTTTLDHFLTDIAKDTREVWTPLMCLLIRELLALPDDKFAVHGQAHYSAFTECITLSFDSALGDLGFLLASFFQRARSFSFSGN